MRKTIGLAVLAMLILASCGTEDEQAAKPQTISVTASNYKFVAPASVSSGAVAVRLTNNGPEPHQAQLFKLNAGVDAGQIVAAAKADASGGTLLPLGTYAGGPDAVDKGESEVTTGNIEPGSYVFMCLVPDAKGQAHAGLGMVSALTVTSNDNQATVPATDYTATTKEFSFGLPAQWSGSIEVRNVGKQPHEFQIMEIAPGKTAEDFEAFFRAPPGQGPPGPPPWTTGGGVAVIAPGQKANFEADVQPGTYYLMCFVVDPVKKVPHFALGMMQKFEVK